VRHSIPLKVAAAVEVVFGLPLLLAPQWLVSQYGAPALGPSGIYNSMLLGGSLLAFAIMNWVASGAPAAHARTVVVGNVAGNVLGLLVTLQRQLFSPDAVPAGWVNVLIYLAFSVLFLVLYRSLRGGDAAVPAEGRTAAAAGP